MRDHQPETSYEHAPNFPALPQGVAAVHQPRWRPLKDVEIGQAIWEAGIHGVRRPYLLFVDERRLRAVSLHAALLPLKPRAKRNPETRAEASRILRERIDADRNRDGPG